MAPAGNGLPPFVQNLNALCRPPSRRLGLRAIAAEDSGLYSSTKTCEIVSFTSHRTLPRQDRQPAAARDSAAVCGLERSIRKVCRRRTLAEYQPSARPGTEIRSLTAETDSRSWMRRRFFSISGQTVRSQMPRPRCGRFLAFQRINSVLWLGGDS